MTCDFIDDNLTDAASPWLPEKMGFTRVCDMRCSVTGRC